jgi:hypothetical protein
MARKKLKNVAKIAAALGAAYALSKMGKGTMDGTEGDFPSTPEPKKVPQASQAMGDEYMDTRSGMKNPRYNKGGSVHVKTKIGYSKPTKIC